MAYEVHTVLLIFFSYILYKITKWIQARREAHNVLLQHGIPGPKPSFLRGNLSELKAERTPSDTISKWIKQYGNVFGYYTGEIPYIVINDQEMLKEVMIKEFENFTNRPDMFMEFSPICHSILALKDQRWREVRSILTPTFSVSKIKKMAEIMNEKIATMITVVRRKVNNREDIEMHGLAQALTLDIIADCALAMQVNCQENKNDPFLCTVKTFFLNASSRATDLMVMFPFLRHVLKFATKFFTSMRMISSVAENVYKAIKHRRQNPTTCRCDILQLMLNASGNNSITEDIGDALTDIEIIASASAVLLAGYETTATSLAFTFSLLVEHPEVQEKLYGEISENCLSTELTYDSLQNLRYMDQVINESLRMYPPVIGFIYRQCKKTCQIGKYIIPEGSVVLAPIWNIHHDPELWSNPWSFDPDRFAPENKSNISSTSYFPFGIGPRICIGMRLAMLEIKLTLVRLIREFRFVACDKTDMPLTLKCPHVIIHPAKGVFLKAISRDMFLANQDSY